MAGWDGARVLEAGTDAKLRLGGVVTIDMREGMLVRAYLVPYLCWITLGAVLTAVLPGGRPAGRRVLLPGKLLRPRGGPLPRGAPPRCIS